MRFRSDAHLLDAPQGRTGEEAGFESASGAARPDEDCLARVSRPSRVCEHLDGPMGDGISGGGAGLKLPGVE
jgi:hypothetical protein